ncbi:UNVERIFIED_CONTAM: hypothetical protein K2H54_018361 [Gekko kuhli]
MPLVIDLLDNKDLLETCIDNAVGLPSAGESAGAVEEASLGFFGYGTKEHPSEKVDSAAEDTSLKLKQLEAELSPAAGPHTNVNINVNKQDEVVKLTEKCLNNAIESPGSASAWLPPDLKSNILKAQAEAGHKITREDSMYGNKNTNVLDAAARNILLTGKMQNNSLRAHSPVFQEPREGLPAIPASNAFVLNELNQESAAASPEDLSNPPNLIPVEEADILMNSSEDLEILLTTQAENLIDFTEAMPRVSSPPTIVPRWLVPGGFISNGPLGNDVASVLKTVKGSRGTPAASSPPQHSPEITPCPVAEDATTRPKCLLTTEL